MSASKLSPWTAQPLSAASKDKHFRAMMNLSAERVILGRSAIVVGWVMGGVGLTAFCAAIFLVVELMPLKETKYVFEEIDKSTGIISQPVGIQDVPKMFGEAVEAQYLRRYVEAREGFVTEIDERNDHLAKVMSMPDEQARYVDSRSAANSPVRLGKDGHVALENFRFHLLGVAKDGITRSYLVQFDRTVWHGAGKDAT
jgi:type IV secretory pathway component VirB8